MSASRHLFVGAAFNRVLKFLNSSYNLRVEQSFISRLSTARLRTNSLEHNATILSYTASSSSWSMSSEKYCNEEIKLEVTCIHTGKNDEWKTNEDNTNETQPASHLSCVDESESTQETLKV